MYLEIRKKTGKARSKTHSGNDELREIEHREKVRRKAKNQRNRIQGESNEMRKERQRVKKVCLGKCGKTEKALTGNETGLLVKRGHMATMQATLP